MKQITEDVYKKDEPFEIIACDFSMRRPGFAVLAYHPFTRKVKV